jgi:hypothetical protein
MDHIDEEKLLEPEIEEFLACVSLDRFALWSVKTNFPKKFME